MGKKHNWADIRRRYLSGEWLTYETAAIALGIRPGYIRQVAAKGHWNAKRTAMEQEVERRSMERLTVKLTQEAAKRIPGWLDLADALRFKALQALAEETMKLSGGEAIRAAQAVVDIEAQIFLPPNQRRRLDGEEAQGPTLQQFNINLGAPSQPATMTVPTALPEITDDSLVRFLGAKPVDARVVESKDRAQPARGGSRAAASKKSPK